MHPPRSWHPAANVRRNRLEIGAAPTDFLAAAFFFFGLERQCALRFWPALVVTSPTQLHAASFALQAASSRPLQADAVAAFFGALSCAMAA